MREMFLDYETRSELDLSEVGLDLYVTGPTDVILAAYAFDDDPVKLWQPHLGPMPKDLEEGLADQEIIIWSWNSAFERTITDWVLGIKIAIRRFRDAMIQARYMSLPGSLDECGKVLRITPELLKTDTGNQLKNLFCLPAKPGGQETLFGLSKPVFRDWDSHPKEWADFCSYCVQDVTAERAIVRRLKDFPVPESEWELFALDQEINDRGIYTDSTMVAGGAAIAEIVKTELLKRLTDITKLENSNSRDQMLGWLQTQGYSFHSLGKGFVMRALAGECQLTPIGREALTIRQQAAKTGATKLVNMASQLSPDNRLRYQYNFYGARTGRWTSGAGD